MEVEKSLNDLPNEILYQIFATSGNHKSLSLVCKRFYQVVTGLNKDNLKLKLYSGSFINPSLNIDELLAKASKISLHDAKDSYSETFNDKIEFFLKKHGARVTHLETDLRVYTKFMHLLPNLEYLDLGYVSSSEAIQGMEKYSIPLKTLALELNSTFAKLDVFDIDGLRLYNNDEDEDTSDKCLQFIQKCRNLKRFKLIYCTERAPNVLGVLSEKELTDLHMNFDGFSDGEIVEFLATQGSLRMLNASYCDDSDLKSICENVTELHSLTLYLNDWKKYENLCLISNLKSLKHLEICYKSAFWKAQDMLQYLPPSLESLTINETLELNVDEINLLAKAFTNLKSFVLHVKEPCYKTVLPAILKAFNQLESLCVKSIDNRFWSVNDDKDDELNQTFYTTSHKNVNLKSLELSVYERFDAEKLLQKILLDFPNLQTFPSELCKKLLRSKLENLREFRVNLVVEENLNKTLEGCSVKFRDTKADVKRDEKGVIAIEFKQYCQMQQHQAMLQTPRKLTALKLQLYEFREPDEFERFVAYLKAIGQHIAMLKITLGSTHSSQLKQVIETLPCLEHIIFDGVRIDGFDGNICEINNQRVKSIDFKLVKSRRYDTTKGSFRTFCKYFRFPNSRLKHFKLTVTGTYGFKNTSYRKSARIFLKNQSQLSDIVAGYEDTGYVFHYQAKSNDFCDENVMALSDDNSDWDGWDDYYDSENETVETPDTEEDEEHA